MNGYFFNVPAGEASLLTHDLDNPNQDERMWADVALVSLGPSAVESLITALHDSDPNCRMEAARLLGEIHDPAAAAALVEALNDSSMKVQDTAANSLFDIGREALQPLLRSLTTSPISCEYRVRARMIFRNLYDRGVVDPLAEKVMDALECDSSDAEINLAAQQAL